MFAAFLSGLQGMAQKKEAVCTCNLTSLSQPITGQYELALLPDSFGTSGPCRFTNVPSLVLHSATDSIIPAIASGTVLTVFDVEDEKVVLVKTGTCSIAYLGLRNAFVEKGASVSSGQALGKMILNDKNHYELEIQLIGADAKVLNPESCLGRLLHRSTDVKYSR